MYQIGRAKALCFCLLNQYLNVRIFWETPDFCREDWTRPGTDSKHYLTPLFMLLPPQYGVTHVYTSFLNSIIVDLQCCVDTCICLVFSNTIFHVYKLKDECVCVCICFLCLCLYLCMSVCSVISDSL